MGISYFDVDLLRLIVIHNDMTQIIKFVSEPFNDQIYFVPVQSKFTLDRNKV